MPISTIREDIKIDQNHVDLIYGLVVSAKPRSLLEFGLGRGVSTDRILDAIRYNAIPKTRYTVVDNWKDFGGVMPAEAQLHYANRLTLVTGDEGEYVAESLLRARRFDFILGDGDHFNSEKYFDDVYGGLLNPGGILIYHDVVGAEFPNLHEIPRKARTLGLHYALFTQSTRPDEFCGRGLIVIFKK
jgi:predicted O-methyltransferase YrrM